MAPASPEGNHPLAIEFGRELSKRAAATVRDHLDAAAKRAGPRMTAPRPPIGEHEPEAAAKVAILLATARALNDEINHQGRGAIDAYIKIRAAHGASARTALRELTEVTGMKRTSLRVAFGRRSVTDDK